MVGDGAHRLDAAQRGIESRVYVRRCAERKIAVWRRRAELAAGRSFARITHKGEDGAGGGFPALNSVMTGRCSTRHPGPQVLTSISIRCGPVSPGSIV